MAAHGLLAPGGQQVDAAALADTRRGNQHVEAGLAQQAAHAHGFRRAAADAVEQQDLARIAPGVGQQALEQGLVIAGGDVLGDLGDQQRAATRIVAGLDLDLGEGCASMQRQQA